MTKHFQYSKLPGSDSRWLGLNHLQAIRPDALRFIATLKQLHPDLAHIRVLNENIVHVFHPDLVREILVEQAEKLHRWEKITRIFSTSMGESVLVTHGAQWQRQRRMLQPGFTPKRVDGFARLMVTATTEALNNLNQAEPIDVDELMTDMTLDVILRTLFSHHDLHDARRIGQSNQYLSSYGFEQTFTLFSWPMWMPLPKVQRARQARNALHRLVKRQIQNHGTLAHADDLLSLLQQVRDPENPTKGLNQQEVFDQIMALFQAGHETTATAMSWWCGLMAHHPHVAQKVQSEIDSVLQGNAPTPEQIRRLPWLNASLKEALRLYPAAALLFSRRALQDIHAGPWTIPKGHLISISPYVIHRDERWFADPQAFKPERFLPNAPDIPRGSWLPFGTGPHVCIGQHFALLEMGIMAVMLLQRFSLEWPQGVAWPHYKLGLTLKAAPAIKLNLVARD